MFYNLLLPLLSEFTIFNVLRYVTFRSVWALLTALVISIILGPRFIKLLHKIKYGQQINEDVTMHKQKAGTPTMGGLLMAFSITVSTLLWGDLSNKFIWLCLLVFLGFGLVGFIDDYLIILRKNNKGITPRQKMIGLSIVSGLAMLALLSMETVDADGNIVKVYSTQLAVPFFKSIKPDLTWLYIPFGMFVMLGASNGVNLTDGLDGLAVGPCIVAGSCFALFIYIAGNSNFANYLIVPHIKHVSEATIFAGAFVGACMGFLWFNAHPAQLFMGDVGSLSLGGTLGFMAIICKQELILPVVGGLFVLETCSVILQVMYFKLTGGKRIFRMAPLHHHYELKGIPESKIIIRFWLIAILLGLFSLSVLKLR